MIAVFKFYKKIFLAGHNTKLVGHVPRLGYVTDDLYVGSDCKLEKSTSAYDKAPMCLQLP